MSEQMHAGAAHEPDGPLAAADFDSFCAELSSLAGEVGRLDLPPLMRRRVEAVAANASAQHFRIVLVSPFQGGKSTIFNTMSGGRELSPTGFGLKTSAAVAEVRYRERADGDDYAELTWRSDVDLLTGIQDVTGEAPGIQLSSAKDRRRLIATLREVNDKTQREHEMERFDPLRIARLTVEHYEATTGLRAKTRVSLEEATSFLAFPERWERREEAQLRPEELGFLFLEKAVFYVREAALRTLRAAIVDVPGLQGSTWERALTLDCIRQAHAIVFLLGTQARGLSEGEVEQLMSFQPMLSSANVFYGYNARRSRREVTAELLPHDLAILRRAGFDIPPDHVAVFHALLAYRARQAALLAAHLLPEHSIAVLSALAERSHDAEDLPEHGAHPLDNARFQLQSDLESSYSIFTGKHWNGAAPDAIRLAEAASQWEDLVGRVSRFVIARKGAAILLDRGGLQLAGVLQQLDGDLRDREGAAERSVEAVKHEQEAAEIALAAFDAKLADLQQSSEARLALQGRHQLGDELRARMENTRALQDRMDKVIDETTYPRYLPGRLASAAREFVVSAIGSWQASLVSGTSEALRSVTREVLKPVEQEFAALAAAAAAKAPGLLGGRPVFVVPEAVKVATDEIDAIVKNVFWESQITKAANWFESVLDEIGMGDAFAWLRQLTTDMLETKIDWRQRAASAIMAVKGVAQKIGDRVVDAQVAALQQAVRAEIAKAAGEVRASYERRLAQRNADLEQSESEKQRIAREAAAKRAEVGRVQQRVDDFIARASARMDAKAIEPMAVR